MSNVEQKSPASDTLMDSYTATGIAEGWIDGTVEEQRAAWQYLVDTGLAWQLQGWFGRTAAALIEAGEIHAKAS